MQRPLSRRPFRHTALRLESLEARENPVGIGVLDQSFAGTGIFVNAGFAGDDSYRDVALTPDGAYIAVGEGNNNFIVTRLLPDGTVDPAFGTKSFDFAGAADNANAVYVQANGQIIVVGTAAIGGDTDIGVLRLDAAGNELDRTSLNVAGGANDTGEAVVVNEGTGDVYVVGGTSSNNDFVVARLDANLDVVGTIQTPTFGGADDARGVALDGTGRVYVSGTANGGNVGMLRYNADLTGVITQEYNLGGNDLGRRVTVNRATGQVFVTGRTDANGTDDFFVLRLDPDLGAAPQTQIILPINNVDRATGIVLDAFGRVVVSGRSDNQLAVARLTNDLVRDATFGVNGVATVNLPGAAGTQGTGVAVDFVGRIVVVGQSGQNPAAIRLGGAVGVPSPLAISGTSNGSVPVLNTQNNNSYNTTPVATLTPIGGASVNSVIADVNGDGTADLVSGVNAGSDRVVVVSGTDGTTVLASFQAFGGYAGGVFVAAGDMNNDGRAEVVVSPVLGGFGPRVAVFSGASMTGGTNNPTKLADFNGIADANTGQADNTASTIANVGARIAVGDANGDGVPDLAVAAGFNGGPRITIWDGKNVAAANGGVPAQPPLANAFVFESRQRDGAFVTLGDVTGDGLADLIAGGGPNGGPRVRIGDMAAILAARNFGAFDDQLGVVRSNFFAGDPDTRGGIRVAARDVDGDNIADLVTGSGAGLPSRAQLFLGTRLVTFTSGVQTGDQVFDPFGATLANGVFVG